MSYIEISNQVVQRLSDGAYIPADQTNADYAEYLRWLADGNTPTPAAPTPTPARQLSSLEFLDLFTQAEQLAIVEASMVNAQVKLWYDRALAAQFITVADPRTSGGLQALVDGGLLTAARKAEIEA